MYSKSDRNKSTSNALTKGLFLLLLFAGTKINSQSLHKTELTAATVHHDSLYYTITLLADSSFGYDIYLKKKLFIRQSTIPALTGKTGFKTKEEAQTVASLCIDKIKRKEFPPGISIEELKALKINSN